MTGQSYSSVIAPLVLEYAAPKHRASPTNKAKVVQAIIHGESVGSLTDVYIRLIQISRAGRKTRKSCPSEADSVRQATPAKNQHMKFSIWAVALAAAFLTTACGGGGGGGASGSDSSSGSSSSGTGSGSTGGSTSTTSNAYVTVGDYRTYLVLGTLIVPGGTGNLGPAGGYYVTDTVTGVGSDGSYTVTEADSMQDPISSKTLSSNLQELAYKTPTFSCSNSPQTDNPGRNLTVGQNWNISYTRTCINSAGIKTAVTSIVNSGYVKRSMTYPITSTNSVNAYELVYEVASTPEQGVTTYTSYDCYKDSNNGQILSCGSLANTPGVKESYSYNWTFVGNSAAGGSTQNPTALAYAGWWSFSWTGSTSGTCPKVALNNSGFLSGSCTYVDQNGQTNTANLVGGVRPTGVLVNLKVGSTIAMTGAFTTPLQGSGTWSSSDASGTWQAVHL